MKDALKEINEEFEKYKTGDFNQQRKNQRYAELMTLLERTFKIPLFGQIDNTKEEIKLYQEISNARDFSIYE